MKEIKLDQGQVALVDDEDFEYIDQWWWKALKSNNTFYATYLSKTYLDSPNPECRLMHRAILKPPKHLIIDHINHNGLDNRRCNIRIVTPRENSSNMITQAEYIGVQKTPAGKYRARIFVNGKNHHLGTFDTPEKAHQKYLDVRNSLT